MTLMGLTVPKLIAIAKPPIARPYRLACQAATYQAGSGSRVDGTQAAHNLPADLTLNGRSVWTYAQHGDTADAHTRAQLQIEYSAAATVAVPRLANHLDSQWEKNGLIDIWLEYIRSAVDSCSGLGDGGPVDARLLAAASCFRRRCAETLAITIARVEASDVFQANRDELNGIFDICADKVEQYQPAARLATMWRIYARPRYR
jgi:hypothetical protein